jgi:hypothetical protein
MEKEPGSLHVRKRKEEIPRIDDTYVNHTIVKVV